MRRIWIILVAGLVVLAAAGGGGFYYWDKGKRGSVDPCNADEVVELVAKGFDGTDLARFERLRAVALDNIAEMDFKYFPPERDCSARVVGNDFSRKDIIYSVSNASDREIRVRLSIPRVTEGAASTKPN
jgi:hypothetical protein